MKGLPCLLQEMALGFSHMRYGEGMMEKRYSFHEVEKRIRHMWEGCFQADLESSQKPYTIMMPPPNVTGFLHLGHGLSSTIQDILIRFHRMNGRDAFWLPGTDHAGIATQMMVEKSLMAQGITRQSLGREKFLEKVWEWKEHHGSSIVEQMQRMGFSADWDRLAFTMDPDISKTVIHSFVELYRRGLIYRARRLINWDHVLQTALSDLEIEKTEEEGTMWTLAYPLRSSGFLHVATTRPETLFGDVAVAVHPDDVRYKHLVGQEVCVPFVNRWVPVIADEDVDPEKGTGAVKITPAHDFLDFTIGTRHHFTPIDILDEKSCLNQEVPEKFQGMDIITARKAVLSALGEDGVVKTEKIMHSVPLSQRSGCRIEPRLTFQWFVDTTSMAMAAKKAVEEGRTRIIPQEGRNNYFEWLDNIQPWCISRQLWWGHQIPVWFGPDDDIFVAESAEEAHKAASEKYGASVELRQDEDVLDTWFSSALWPFSTLGWPAKTSLMARYYPTDVLVTGHDIIFFWVARMMMMALELTGDIPFHTVYLHPLIQDERGAKMSKTKGNVINPLDVIDSYGADALRFALALSGTQTRHVRFGMKQVEKSRNFVTKLWNVGRFLFLHDVTFKKKNHESSWIFSQWIVGEAVLLQEKVSQLLQEYRIHEAATVLYHFVWDVFCDKFVELAKNALRQERQEEILAVLAWVFHRILLVLHPMIPFVTEEIWRIFWGENESVRPQAGYLCHGQWTLPPHLFDKKSFAHISKHVEIFYAVLTAARHLRAEFNIGQDVCFSVEIYNASSEEQSFLEEQKSHLLALAGMESLNIFMEPLDGQTEKTKGTAQISVHQMIMVIPIADFVDLDLERARLQKVLEKEQGTYEKLMEKLQTKDFVDHAPQEVVDDIRQRADNQHALLHHIRSALAHVS